MYQTHTPLQSHYTSQQPTNRRGQSLLEHISPASRQTLQQLNHNANINRPQYHQYESNSPESVAYKENRVNSRHPYDYEAHLRVEGGQVKAQNELLRE